MKTKERKKLVFLSFSKKPSPIMGKRHEITIPNTIRIEVEDSKNVNTKTIMNVCTDQLDLDLDNDVLYITTPFSAKEWLVTLANENLVNRIVGTEIKINEKRIKVENFNIPKKKIVYEAYKVLWLLPFTNIENLRDYILNLLKSDGNNIRIVKCYQQIYKDRDHESAIMSGKPREVNIANVIFVISYDENERIYDIRGKHNFNGKKIRIIKKGDDEKCFGCKESGHIISKCPYSETICTKCKKKGHKICTYSGILDENSQLPQHEEDTLFDETEKTSHEKNANEITNLNTNNQIENQENKEYENLDQSSNSQTEITVTGIINEINEKKRALDVLNSSTSTTTSTASPTAKIKKINSDGKEETDNEACDESMTTDDEKKKEMKPKEGKNKNKKT